MLERRKRERERRARGKSPNNSVLLSGPPILVISAIDPAPFIQQVRGRSVKEALSDIVESEVKLTGGNTVPAKQY